MGGGELGGRVDSSCTFKLRDFFKNESEFYVSWQSLSGRHVL